ncbi:Glycoside hydrolase family 17 - like 10 [Theobroma cacao]|uniref:glucan endo-1,3-beta-D-glucosidase n=1 Tax=Theobroma cacao TaxID=3641 RepID=A0A061G6V7_THECC|nr:Glycosyl hydrolase superfamily protein, putative [Theobroma cacao]WRX17997.1 Glycoside hydrolase family 17 - like 10 [Theobroma cacao]
MNQLLCFTSAFCLILFHGYLSIAEAGLIGVNYGMLGNNLPPPSEVIALLKSRQITRVRLFDPNYDALQALQGSGIDVILGTLNQDLQNLGSDLSFARNWVQENVIPYSEAVTFRCISAGNEVIPGDLAVHVLPAMRNLKTALREANLGEIPVSTTVSTAVLGNSYPPSRGEFTKEVSPTMKSITEFLAAAKSPLLVNVYPYFAYIYDQQNISLAYALFNSSEVVVKDGQLGYKNLFDAITDAVYSALEKVGGNYVVIVVSESGWPSNENGEIATIANAQMYNNKLIAHVSGASGTPKRPGRSIDTYVFAIFNENLKPSGTEQHFGLYYPNMTEVYHVEFTQ